MNHPMGVYAVSITEMWERFSFFIFSGILILFMIQVLHLSTPFSNVLYGLIIGGTYLMQPLSGYFTDKYLGNRKAIVIGGTIMLIAQIIFTYDASLYYLSTNVPVHSSFLSTFPECIFLIGVALFIIGNSFFKISVTSFVSLFYKDQENLLDSAFTIFYMLSNIGAFLAPFILSFVVGVDNPSLYQYGFLIGVIAVALGLLNHFLVKDRYLHDENGEELGVIPISKIVKSKLEDKKEEKLSQIEKDRIKVSIILLLVVIIFYLSLEQTSTSFLMLTMNYVDNQIPFTNVILNPEFYVGLNPLFVTLLSPISFLLMTKLAMRNKEPSSASKLSIGLFILIIGFLMILIPKVSIAGKINMIWIVLFNLFLVMSELFIMPIALSLISKLAPLKHASLMMGVLFTATAISEILTGLFASAFPEPGKTNKLLYLIPINNLESFLMVFIILIGIVFIFWTLSRNKIKKLMHGIE